jgi:hypothetical protein
MTTAKLHIEVEATTAKLDEIKNLEVRIDKEMDTVAEGINNMEDMMPTSSLRSTIVPTSSSSRIGVCT